MRTFVGIEPRMRTAIEMSDRPIEIPIIVPRPTVTSPFCFDSSPNIVVVIRMTANSAAVPLMMSPQDMSPSFARAPAAVLSAKLTRTSDAAPTR